ncbi:MAG TPA: amidase family protein, partial [Caulobacteraceae bacterium]|nr:amidase family protein [Caulobacteraceae bacterium]
WTDDFGYAGQYAVAETAQVIETVKRAVWRLRDAGAEIETLDEAFESPFWASNQWTASDVAISADYDLGFKAPSREEIIEARASRRRIWETFRTVTARNDFILSPTTLEVAPTRKQWAIDGIPADFAGPFLAMTAFGNLIGWPAVTVPAGLVDGLPVGLQIMGRPNSEPRIFQLAQAFLAAQA